MAELWTLLASGTCAVARIPEDRWSLDRLAHPRGSERGRSYTWAAGVLQDVWGFDPAAFGLSPREAEQMDPQQRLLLELCWEAFEDAGIRPSTVAGSDTGVFVGASALDYGNLRILDSASGDAYMMTGNTLSIISNRISYIFDFHGPSFTVDTACSSALVALNEAVGSLRSGRIDTAVVGGVNILASPFNFVGFSQASMLSRTGLCQAFSANADGYVRAEGGVVLVLRTREAAERNRDPIKGFIVGSDVNSDGRTNGISLPSKTYQAQLLDRLYVKAGLDPERLAFVEAHGTGTRIGDPIEAAAIGETLGQKRGTPLLIGSIKTNIGHMEAASGLGGVLKAMLALEHDALPASLHSQDLNPDINFDALNLRVVQTLTPLAGPSGFGRLAGVNAFGFGGTNAHVILADGPRPIARLSADPAPSFLMVSAHSRAALRALIADYATRLDHASDHEAMAIVGAAAFHRERLPHRVIIPMADRRELVDLLDRLGDDEPATIGAARGTALEREAPVAFVFSGNGSQFVGMGLAAYARNADFRARLQVISAEFATLAGWSIVETLHAPDLAAKIELTQISQPLLYAVQSAACHALRARGLEPAFVLGHSVGEVAAAEAAGILDHASAIRTIFARSLHQELTFGRGGMAVLIGSYDAAMGILDTLPSLEIAAYNSPRAFTVSGDRDDMDRLPAAAKMAKMRVRKLDISYPFHSALMAPVERPLLSSLSGLTPRRSDVPFISTVTGDIMDGPELGTPYWWRNIREPVRFAAAIGTAAKAGARIFVEVGPTASLLSHISDCIDERTTSISTSCALQKKDNGVDPIVNAVAIVLARGASVDERKAFGSRYDGSSAILLPLYPWQRNQFRLSDTTESPGLTRPGQWHPLAGSRSSADRLEWHSTLDTTLHPWLADHRVDGRIILPGAAFAEMALAVSRDWLGTATAAIVDLEITSPMVLASDTTREVVCRVSPLIGHLEIASRPRLSEVPWQPHATAKIIRDRIAFPHELARDTHDGSRVVTGAEIYAAAADVGLQYGPAFRKLASARIDGRDHIRLELATDAANPAFGIDPRWLDSCFHALVLLYADTRLAKRASPLVPVRFGEIVILRPGMPVTHALVDVTRKDERAIVVNISLTGKDGDGIMFIRDARFQAIRIQRGAAAQMILQKSILASEPTAACNDRPLSLAILRAGALTEAGHAIGPDIVLLEGWATAVAFKAARALAHGDIVDVDGLVHAGRIPARVKPWLDDVLTSLEHSGLARRDGLRFYLDLEVELPEPEEILRVVASEHQNLSAEILVAASVEAALKDLANPDLDAFGQALSERALDGWESSGSQVQAAAGTVIDLLRRTRADWPEDRALRILQIGHGPLTSLMAAFSEETEARLTVFDTDQRRLERARLSFSDRDTLVVAECLADLASSAFDIVVAAHALHRHGREAALWEGLARIMAPSAIFVAVEPMRSFFSDLILGFGARLDGEGQTLGRDIKAFSASDWLETMRAAGLGDPEVVALSGEAGRSLLLTAELAAARRSWSGDDAVLVIGDGEARGTEATSAFATLLAASGFHVSVVLDSEPSKENLDSAPKIIVMFVNATDDQVGPAKSLLESCMRLKRIVDRIADRETTLWIVTTGALGSETGHRADDVAAGLWAFTRTLANETPTLTVRRVDIATLRSDVVAERLRDLVLSKTDETEIEIGPTATRVVRFRLMKPDSWGRTNRAEAARLVRAEGTAGERINWEPVERRDPGLDDVEIAVEAIGLNFRDVMLALGLLPDEILEHGFAGPTLGLECAGRILRVGAGVTDFGVGDRVIAFSKHAFATHVTTPAALVAPIPGELSFDLAATIPVAFLTAYHALISCARLKPNEWVLIHGGAGGVGLAALQIARWRGARIIATAGTTEKRALLSALGAEHVFDSRSGAFLNDVRNVTHDGVDVVLNSLSGEAMEGSIGLMRPYGRFVELGKRDYVTNTYIGLRPFRRNLSYFGVDLDQLLLDDPAAARLLMVSILNLFAKGVLSPLPFRVVAASETADAFRAMQQSRHIGKLVVRPPRLENIGAKQETDFHIASDKIHLVTGGLGGFGLEAAHWLVKKGAKHLILVGRSGAANQSSRDGLAVLASKGVRVEIEAMDIANKAGLDRLFARFGKDLPALGGVIHAAMVLEDAMIVNLSKERFEQVLRPKVAGADHLDRLTHDLALDYFVLFSSVATLIGNPGQAAYVAANGYLEGLARRRLAAGRPALTICWGAIADAGILARSESVRETLANRAGVESMFARDALDLMGQALGGVPSHANAVVTIAQINWSAAHKHLTTLRGPSYTALTRQDDAKTGGQRKIDIDVLMAENTPDEARRLVGDLIVDEIARVLRLPRDDIARTSPLADIGLDSLMAVELALGLEERFALSAPLSAAGSGFTVNELADHVIGLSTGALSGDEAILQGLIDRHIVSSSTHSALSAEVPAG